MKRPPSISLPTWTVRRLDSWTMLDNAGQGHPLERAVSAPCGAFPVQSCPMLSDGPVVQGGEVPRYSGQSIPAPPLREKDLPGRP